MKLRALPAICSLAVSSVCTVAHATLIGDTITLSHVYTQNPNSPFEIQNVAVVAGTADVRTLVGFYTVNPEASSILVSFLGFPNAWGSGGSNGLVISGIDDTISAVSVSTNLVGWTDSRMIFNAHSLSPNWEGLPFSSSSFFNLTLTLSPTTPNSVPDTGATAALFGLSLAGLVGLQRRLSRTKN
jgi:hypothetical protein